MAEKRSHENVGEDTSIAKKAKSDAVTAASDLGKNESLDQTSASSIASKNDAALDLKLLHLDNYEIIWFSPDAENPIKFNRLRAISGYVKFFDNLDSCREYIQTITAASNQSTIFLVTSGHSAEKLLSTVSHLSPIWSIHCLIKDPRETEGISNDPKIKTFTALQLLIKSLLNDIRQQFKNDENEKIFDLISSGDNKDNTTEDIESWWPKLIHILVHLPYPKDCFHRFISTMRECHAKNPPELKSIDALERNYVSAKEKNPVQEYTKDTFLYRLINRALRQKNIQAVFLFGFLLRDLYQQLKEEHEKFRQIHKKDRIVTVHRGQYMSKTEVEELTNGTRTIVTSSFLSTTADPAMAEIYLGTSDPDDEQQSVLFEMQLKLAEKSFPYADISAISWFPSESEILLMPGLEFQMTEKKLYYDPQRQIWLAQLELMSDTIEKGDDRIFNGFTNRRIMRNYIELLTETLTDFCHATIEHIQAVFDQLVELFPAEKWILAVKMSCLAMNSLDCDSNYPLALEKFDEALNLWSEFKNDHDLNADISIGQIYYSISTIYYYSLEDFPKTRENVNLSINHYRIAIESGLTNSEELKIYELLHEMYGMKIAIKIKDETDDSIKEENVAMYMKYLKLHLESMLKSYEITNKGIDVIARELTDYYDLCEMYDEHLSLLKKLLERYRQNGVRANSERIRELLQKIISIYYADKDDRDAAEMYQSLLDKHEEETDPEAYDDYGVDYRQCEGVEVESPDEVQPRRRWSTLD